QLEQEEYLKLVQELQGLNRTLSTDLYGAGSLFAKALKTTLGDGLSGQYRTIQHEEDRERYLARVEQFILTMDGALGLSAAQRQRLTDVLVRETVPPRKFGQNDIMFITYQVSRLPEAGLRPIFDDAQWSSLRQRLVRAASAPMVDVLKQGGYLDLTDRVDANLTT